MKWIKVDLEKWTETNRLEDCLITIHIYMYNIFLNSFNFKLIILENYHIFLKLN